MPLSNELSASVFYTNPEVQLIPLSTPEISLYWRTGPDIRFDELSASVFYTNPEVRLVLLPAPEISLYWRTGPDIRFDVLSPGDTGAHGAAYAVTLLSILSNTEIAGVLFKSLLLVQLRRTLESVIAETWLDCIYEYGVGQNDSEAVVDLVTSLGEYFDALETREQELGDSTRQELDALRRLIERKGVSQG